MARELALSDAQLESIKPRLRELTAAIAELEAELRFVHLQAHLSTTPLLTPEQIRRYEHARGYADAPEHH